MSKILERFKEKYRSSQALHRQAAEVLPTGVTHDGRYINPFPLYIEKAKGSRKWDVDGQELIDYWMGHGSLLLGHVPDEVEAAVTKQVALGTHYGACHGLELRWAGLIREMMAGAEMVRFVASGTEATLLALRVARAYTGREKVLRFHGHFHGWQDYMVLNNRYPFNIPTSRGLPEGLSQSVLDLRHNDITAVKALFDREPDIAAVIMEPTGATQGKAPTSPEFTRQLRELTAERGIPLIFDEVVTGFRYGPGGAQGELGVTPDLTTLGKVVAGGMPGGALVGRKEVMEPLVIKGDPYHDRYVRVMHPGTFNANPVCAAAAVAQLELAKSGQPQAEANRLAGLLREGMNEVLEGRDISGCVYGESSIFHIAAGSDLPRSGSLAELYPLDPARLLKHMGAAFWPFRQAFLYHGVDLMGPTGFVSSAHTEEDIQETVDAFDKAMADLQAEGIL